ncbi:MAG: hypothetical protein NVS9B2_30160 [Steroidobacteraceae bacterium]
MLRDATQRTFFEILEVEGIGYTYLKQENKLTLDSNRSEIVFRSLDNPERLRGPNLAWFGVDELTYTKPDAWSRLEARLRDPRAYSLCGFACWTPKGFDAVYEQWIEHPSSQYSCVLASPRENFHVAQTGMYEQLEASYDERLYRQEVLGEYLAINAGRCYYGFDRARDITACEYNPHLPVCWSLDFNYDPACSVLAQMYSSGLVRVFDEIALRDSNTYAVCDALLAALSRFLVPGRKLKLRVYGDASGNARKSSSSRTDWQIVNEFLKSRADLFDTTFCVPADNPPIRDRINTVNARICNAAGDRRLKVDPRCRMLMTDLERVGWKMDAHGNNVGTLDDSDKLRTHASDALGYFLNREFPMRGQVGEKSGIHII